MSTNLGVSACFQIVVAYWHISAYFCFFIGILAYSLRRRNCLVSCLQFGVCTRLSLLLSDLFSFLYMRPRIQYYRVWVDILVSFPDVNKNKCPCIHAKSSSWTMIWLLRFNSYNNSVFASNRTIPVSPPWTFFSTWSLYIVDSMWGRTSPWGESHA